MTDLEITRLCAEMMGSERFCTMSFYDNFPLYFRDTQIIYDPLNDDAQAMALVKRFKLELIPIENNEGSYWRVRNADMCIFDRWDKNLNRAICECIAKTQQAKVKQDCAPT